MENNTSPQYGGDIPKKDRSPISMLKIYTPDAAPESQYPPATEQPEDECVVDLRAHSFESVCQVVTENQVLQARLAASEQRVKALEEALRPLVEWWKGKTEGIPTRAAMCEILAVIPLELKDQLDAIARLEKK